MITIRNEKESDYKKVEEITDIELPKVKIRSLHPIVNGTRIF